jgi:alanyl-tRNA synthetase
MMTSNDIRQAFIDFFVEEQGHTFVPSSPLLPAQDPTLLFANAGMNQFKSIFLGTETRDYVRAANTQKCIRAGGKHNDLEDVGHDCYHHTFFEMLGNWSFGDYFKAESIEWAWQLLTEVWGLPKDRLYATVFGGDAADGLDADSQAEALWREKTDIDPSHILHGDKKDNFWEMGETGPCGPCSELHIDLTEDGSGKTLVNADDARVIEIWNLVFIQYNRDETGKLTPLPAQHVDTGMGFERVCAVMQGKKSNYATDVFVPLIQKIEALSGHVYGGTSGLDDRYDVTSQDDPGDVACRVVADHARTLTFAITDGIMPGNEGRNYVVRRILRRAARYGRQNLGIDGPFLCDLVAHIVEQMGPIFPELVSRREFVESVVREEEESFGRTLDRGIDLFNKQADKLETAGGKTLPGETVFELYATFGFPADLTALMAAERGLAVDQAGFDAAMAEHKALSQAGSAGAFKAADIPDLPSSDDTAKYRAEHPLETTVIGWVVDGQFITTGALEANQDAALVLDATSFYAEQGGQIGDTGELIFDGGRFVVTDTQLAGTGIVHVGSVAAGSLVAGQKVICLVGPARMDIARNHTATHLLNWALREVLGDHVNQAGSVVAADRLRFDFSHGQAVSAEDLAKVERWVNEKILADLPVSDQVMALADAQAIPGVRAMFGEKYPDPVRVVTIGGDDAGELDGAAHPVEFCGGTHLATTGTVGLFKILSEESVAKGVRRITAVTGRAAVDQVQELDRIVTELTGALKAPPAQLVERITAMQKEIKELRKGSKATKGGSDGGEVQVVETLETSAGKVLIAKAAGNDAGAMRTFCDVERNKGAAAVFIGGADDAKVMLVAMVSDDVIAGGTLKAGDWVKQVAPVVGGGGGGKPNLAQAGGKEPAKLDDALATAVEYAREALA